MTARPPRCLPRPIPPAAGAGGSVRSPASSRPARHRVHHLQPCPSGPRLDASHDCASPVVANSIFRTEGRLSGRARMSIFPTCGQPAVWSTLSRAPAGPDVKWLKTRPSPTSWKASNSALVDTSRICCPQARPRADATTSRPERVVDRTMHQGNNRR